MKLIPRAVAVGEQLVTTRAGRMALTYAIGVGFVRTIAGLRPLIDMATAIADARTGRVVPAELPNVVGDERDASGDYDPTPPTDAPAYDAVPPPPTQPPGD